MSTSPYQQQKPSASGLRNVGQKGDVSRRAMLSGAAATTAAVAVGAGDMSAYARMADPNLRQDMMAFLVLSAALTGIQIVFLAPEFDKGNKPDILDADPGVDPFNVKNDYFNWINASDAPTFERLLQIARDHRQSLLDIVENVKKGDNDIRFLARSIVLLWYLGSWYKPEDLAKPPTDAPIPSQVVSAKAYTQGLVWQIAQAHPMGYSNLQFGYWSREPVDPNDPNEKTSPPGFITATLP